MPQQSLVIHPVTYFRISRLSGLRPESPRLTALLPWAVYQDCYSAKALCMVPEGAGDKRSIRFSDDVWDKLKARAIQLARFTGSKTTGRPNVSRTFALLIASLYLRDWRDQNLDPNFVPPVVERPRRKVRASKYASDRERKDARNAKARAKRQARRGSSTRHMKRVTYLDEHGVPCIRYE